jgi:hypothetical protein
MPGSADGISVVGPTLVATIPAHWRERFSLHVAGDGHAEWDSHYGLSLRQG